MRAAYKIKRLIKRVLFHSIKKHLSLFFVFWFSLTSVCSSYISPSVVYAAGEAVAVGAGASAIDFIFSIFTALGFTTSVSGYSSYAVESYEFCKSVINNGSYTTKAGVSMTFSDEEVTHVKEMAYSSGYYDLLSNEFIQAKYDAFVAAGNPTLEDIEKVLVKGKETLVVVGRALSIENLKNIIPAFKQFVNAISLDISTATETVKSNLVAASDVAVLNNIDSVFEKYRDEFGINDTFVDIYNNATSEYKQKFHNMVARMGNNYAIGAYVSKTGEGSYLSWWDLNETDKMYHFYGNNYFDCSSSTHNYLGQACFIDYSGSTEWHDDRFPQLCTNVGRQTWLDGTDFSCLYRSFFVTENAYVFNYYNFASDVNVIDHEGKSWTFGDDNTVTCTPLYLTGTGVKPIDELGTAAIPVINIDDYGKAIDDSDPAVAPVLPGAIAAQLAAEQAIKLGITDKADDTTDVSGTGEQPDLNTDNIPGLLGAAFGFLWDILGKILAGILEIPLVLTKILTQVSLVTWDVVTTGFKDLATWQQVVIDNWDTLTDVLTRVFPIDGFAAEFGKVISGIGNFVIDGASDVAEAFGNGIDDLKDIINDALGALGIGVLLGGIAAQLTSIITRVTDITDTITAEGTKPNPEDSKDSGLTNMLSVLLAFLMILIQLVFIFIHCLEFITCIFNIGADPFFLNDDIISGLNYLKTTEIVGFGISIYDFLMGLVTIIIVFSVVGHLRRNIDKIPIKL